MIYFVLVAFLLMEGFNLVAYQSLVELVDVTQHKLNMMVLTRSLVSTNVGGAHVTYKLLEIAIIRRGIGLEYIDVNSSIRQMKMSWLGTMGLSNNLDHYMASRLVYERFKDDLGFYQVSEVVPCDLFDYKYYGLTYEQCKSLGSGTMGENSLKVYKWMRMSAETIIERISTLEPNYILGMFNTTLFMDYQLMRKGFFIPSFLVMAENIYLRLLKFHERTKSLIYYNLGVVLGLSIFFAALFNLLGILHIKRQVKISLSCLRLLPADSVGKNPYVDTVLIAQTKY